MMCFCPQNDFARVSKFLVWVFIFCALQLSQWFPRKKSVIARLGPVLTVCEIKSVFLAFSEQKFGTPGIMPYQRTSCLLVKILIKEYTRLILSQFYTQFGV